MAKNLEQLSEVTELSNDDLLHVRLPASGEDKKITWNNIKNSNVTTPSIIGSLHYFPYSADLSAYGLLQFAFDNAISQANYPALYSAIGDMYEEQHTDAGDSASGAGMFYPTPVPGAYDRVAIPDIELDATTTGQTYWIHANGTSIDNIKDGHSFKLQAVAGASMPTSTPQLVADTIYYIKFVSAGIRFYLTEADAVAGTNQIDITVGAGSGAFRLTQEGIAIDDAGQGWQLGSSEDSSGVRNSWGIAESRGSAVGTGGADPNQNEVRFKTTEQGSSQRLKALNNGSDGDIKQTNETRPKTNYSFGYINAENVTSSGETISALRYVQDWSLCTAWTAGNSITIPHPFEVAFDEYMGEILVRDPAVPDKIYNVSNLDYFYTVDSKGYGQRLNGIDGDLDNCYLQIEEGQPQYITDSGSIGQVLTTWEYEIVLIKPNLIATVFDVSDLPQTVDLTSADVQVTLPEITGVTQSKSIYWTNGGTYKMTLAVTDGATIGGLSASIWEGEGEGNILLESDGSNWQVRDYEDYLTFSNANDEQRIWKMKEGTEKQIIVETWITALSSAVGNMFRSGISTAITRDHSFNTLFSDDIMIANAGVNQTWVGATTTISTITVTSRYYLMNPQTQGSSTHVITNTAIGRWRT